MLKTTIVYQRSPMLEISLASNPGFDFMKVNFSVWLALSGLLNQRQLILWFSQLQWPTNLVDAAAELLQCGNWSSVILGKGLAYLDHQLSLQHCFQKDFFHGPVYVLADAS